MTTDPSSRPTPAPGGPHPIQVAARRAGLSPDVLRAWERRYGLVAPARSGRGRRLYSDADVERLRLIATAARAGRRISDLGVLSTGELQRLVAEDRSEAAPRSEHSRTDDILAECRAAVAGLDDRALRSTLSRALVAMPAIAFISDVVQPLMKSVGEHWEQGQLSPAHEHLATAVLRRVLQEVTDSLAAGATGPTLVVASPAGQQHEIGGLTVGLAAALEGWRVSVLGGDLPADDIARAVVQLQACAVTLSLSTEVEGTASQVRRLRDQIGPDVPILIGGRAAEVVEHECARAGVQPEVRRLRDLAALRAVLPTLAPG